MEHLKRPQSTVSQAFSVGARVSFRGGIPTFSRLVEYLIFGAKMSEYPIEVVAIIRDIFSWKYVCALRAGGGIIMLTVPQSELSLVPTSSTISLPRSCASDSKALLDGFFTHDIEVEPPSTAVCRGWPVFQHVLIWKAKKRPVIPLCSRSALGWCAVWLCTSGGQYSLDCITFSHSSGSWSKQGSKSIRVSALEIYTIPVQEAQEEMFQPSTQSFRGLPRPDDM